MIEYIKGELTELTPALAVVEAAGVGYALNISLTTYSAIQGKKAIKLYVHESLVTGGRDDNFTLFGFVNKQERGLYRLLITVSGVGANTARMMLSSMSPSELCNAIAKGDLESVKKFIEYGVNVNEQSNGSTPLMLAARYNKVEILKVLIAKGAKADAKDNNGKTALQYAVNSNATEAVAYLKQF